MRLDICILYDVLNLYSSALSLALCPVRHEMSRVFSPPHEPETAGGNLRDYKKYGTFWGFKSTNDNTNHVLLAADQQQVAYVYYPPASRAHATRDMPAGGRGSRDAMHSPPAQ